MNDTAPELSRPLALDRIPQAGIEETIEARPTEREALAQRFDLLELKSLTARLSVRPNQRDLLTVTGSIAADIVQRCVVTLEPLPAHLDIAVDLRLVPAAAPESGGEALWGEDEEDVEYIENGRVDLGELVAQHLGINLDPYPRKPDAALPQTEFGPGDDARHPFAKLSAALKKTKD